MKNVLHAVAGVWPPLLLASSGLAITLSAYSPWWLVAAGGAFTGAMMTDVGARHFEYRRARQTLAEHRYSPKLGSILYRLAAYHQASWCQRTALVWAAQNALPPNGSFIVRTYYKALGYKWWHLTPDGTFTRNSPFLKVAFWASFVGLRGRVQA